MFAYGQTGSGKTFTMFGPHWDEAGSPYSLMEATPFMGANPAHFGLIPRAIERVFAAAEA